MRTLIGSIVLGLVACSASDGVTNGAGTTSGGSAGAAAPSTGGGGGGGATGGSDTGGSGGLVLDAGGTGQSGNDGGGVFVGDPKSCAQAAQTKSYVGCDFWPTVTANAVWPIFDYAVVVANTQDQPATVSIERGGSPVASGTVAPSSLEKFYLPWVDALKGPAINSCGYVGDTLDQSVRAPGGAYHLVSDVPVTVYQFNALEYKGEGGPPGKDWSACPSNSCPGGVSCLSYSNDASLLLPSTALTGNYRVTGMKGWPAGPIPPFFTVTGTEDGTHVSVKLPSAGQVSAGGGLPTTLGSGIFDFSIDRGEVVEVVGTPYADLSGSLVQATAPVQVISGMACVYLPFSNKACDHIEESVFPAETLGTHYFVTRPTGPNGDVPGHIVRLYGNVDGTHLTYAPAKPPNAPDTIDAGQVTDLDVVTDDFEITADHELAAASFELGATVVDPNTDYSEQKGDPSESQMTAVEQYRKKYVFLAPDDYIVSYVDVVLPSAAAVVLDGAPLEATPQPIADGYAVARQKLGPGNAGVHVLTSDQPVGIQVMGYGWQTSYQYPGGSNLLLIAPPPAPIK